MKDSRALKLHLELDIEITDPAAVRHHAQSWAKQQAGNDQQALTQLLDQAAEGTGSALIMMMDPEDLLGSIPGTEILGAAMWAGDSDDETENWPSEAAAADGLEDDTGDIAGDLGGSALTEGGELEDDLESEEEWVNKIIADAARLPGLDLQSLGYDADAPDPKARARSLQDAMVLRGSLHWAYESFIDELFDDISAIRQNPHAIDETLQIGNLPPLYQAHYGPLFAQRFLVVALDLGTAFASSFQAATCVAQELALRLVIARVEILAEAISSLELPEDWQELLLDALFQDRDHELLYSPELDGISHEPALASLGMADLDVAAWFTPFGDSTVNPYAANA